MITDKFAKFEFSARSLSKVSQIRNRGAKQKVLNALENNEFFQRFIHDPIERQQFLTQAAPYVKYKFYPKGTPIVEMQQAISSISIIAKGKALLYFPKDQDEIKKEGNVGQRAQVINLYTKYIQKEQLEERFKKWLNKHEFGTKALRKRMASLSEKDEDVPEKEAPDDDNFRSIIDNVLQNENPLLPPHLRGSDLLLEEKLVILSKFGFYGDLIKNGNVLLKVKSELGSGDTYSASALVKPFHADFIVIAKEDTHIVSFSRSDFKLLFASDIPNIKEKIDFLKKLFSEVPKQIVMEMAYYLEERVLFNSEVVYKEGEDVDAMYFIKNGEIEISTIKESLINEEYFPNDKLTMKIKNKFCDKNKIMVGKLPAGSIFGEDEIIKRIEKRKYSARACQPLTFVYVIRKEIFYNIYEHHFPEIIEILTDWMNLKYKWREQRIKREQQIVGLRSEDNESLFEKENIDKKLIRDEPNMKFRRSTIERDFRIKTQNYDDISSIINPGQRTLTNSSLAPNEFNTFGTSPSFYFSKKQKNDHKNSPRAENNIKLLSQRSSSKDTNFRKETIETQKTKLFLENQSKLNKSKKPVLIQRPKSKTVSSASKKEMDISSRLLQATPQILNFEKVKDLQKGDIPPFTGIENFQLGSHRKTLPASQISPRFFIVKSYGVSQNSLNSLDSEAVNRRFSTQQQGITDNLLPMSTKMLDVRRGTTLPVNFTDENNEEKKVDEFGLRLSLGPSKLRKPEVLGVDSLNSLKHVDKSSNSKSHISSKPGSLAYLDGKNDEIIPSEPIHHKKNASISLKDISFGKKILSPRTSNQLQKSPRVGFSSFKFKIRRSTIEKN